MINSMVLTPTLRIERHTPSAHETYEFVSIISIPGIWLNQSIRRLIWNSGWSSQSAVLSGFFSYNKLVAEADV